MSKVSDISRQYHAALSTSHSQYESLYAERVKATDAFYRNFFKRLVCDFSDKFRDPKLRARLQERIERATGSKELQFIAIDGTCRKEIFSDFITFFGGAYGARGEVTLTGGSHRLRYKRWSLDNDVSMVAWVPVPFARLEEVTSGQGDQFLVSEEERVNLASVHMQVMQLAEVFLAYNAIMSSRLDAPHILLMDLSPSSLLASVARAQETLGLVGYPYDRRSLTNADIAVALAHPLADELAIPSAKRMDRYRLLVAELAKNPGTPLHLASIAARHGLLQTNMV